jgi:hypothetical protein
MLAADLALVLQRRCIFSAGLLHTLSRVRDNERMPTVDVDDVDLGLEPEPEPELQLQLQTPPPEQDELYDEGPGVVFVREGKAGLEGLTLGDDGVSVASFERGALGQQQLSATGSDIVEDAGLAVGSEIVSVDGWRVKNAKHLRRKLKKVPQGNTVSLRFAAPGGAPQSRRLVRQLSNEELLKQQKELRVRLDLTRETKIIMQMKETVSDLKGKIAKAAVKQGIKGSSAEGYADGAFLVIAVVGAHGVRTVLPDELSMRDALMYAERGENEASKEEINYVYLVKYHVPASWHTVGCVRYTLSGVWLALGVMMLIVALLHNPHDCNTEADLLSGPDSCPPKRPKKWEYNGCWYCDQWFDHPDVNGLLRSVDPEDNDVEIQRRVDHLDVVQKHCDELELYAFVCAVLFIVTGLLLASLWFVRNRQLVRAFKKRRQRGRVRHPALQDKQWAKLSEVLLPLLPVAGWLLLQARFWSEWAEFHCSDDIHYAAAWLVVPTWVFAPVFCCVLPCFTNCAFYQFMTPDAEEPSSRDGRKLYCCCFCNIKFWARRSGRHPLASEKFAAENDRDEQEDQRDHGAAHAYDHEDDLNP